MSPNDERSDNSIENVRDNEVVMVSVDQKMQASPESEKDLEFKEDSKPELDDVDSSPLVGKEIKVEKLNITDDKTESKNVDVQPAGQTNKDDLISATSGIYSMTEDIKSEIPIMSENLISMLNFESGISLFIPILGKKYTIYT